MRSTLPMEGADGSSQPVCQTHVMTGPCITHLLLRPSVTQLELAPAAAGAGGVAPHIRGRRAAAPHGDTLRPKGTDPKPLLDGEDAYHLGTRASPGKRLSAWAARAAHALEQCPFASSDGRRQNARHRTVRRWSSARCCCRCTTWSGWGANSVPAGSSARCSCPARGSRNSC
jgi:hypothetical protein